VKRELGNYEAEKAKGTVVGPTKNLPPRALKKPAEMHAERGPQFSAHEKGCVGGPSRNVLISKKKARNGLFSQDAARKERGKNSP